MSPYKKAGCPRISIQRSQFSNTRGCPGSYGNVGLFCQFQLDPYYVEPEADRNYAPYFDSHREGNPVEDYDEDEGIEDEQQDEEDDDIQFFDLPYVTVTDSTFENNLLALSNSLAINGSYFTLLERNTFQNNGGPSGKDLMKYSLGLSKVKWDSYSSSYFGQSTAVYLNGVYRLNTTNNTYKGNWSPFEGSRSLGVSLTILNWVNDDSYSLEMNGDKFIDHTGVPPVIESELRKKLNCYTPPLITVANNFGNSYRYWKHHPPKISLKGVKFENNIANYGPIINRCDYLSSTFTFSKVLTKQINDSLRFRSGFLKFLTPSEAQDKAVNIENNLDSSIGTYSELGLYFSQGEVRNNTVQGGCLFPTLRLRAFLLDDLQIENNQVNPSIESGKDMSVKKQANAENAINNRAGIFCGYQKDAVMETRNLSINADKLKAKDNIGPIFSLFPGELNYLLLTNSLFINNTCEYTSTIIAAQGSTIQASNNIFINNTNAFGTVFTTSSSTWYSSTFTTYLNNTGRHASLIYSDNKAIVVQSSSRVDSNTVIPNTYFFADNTMPQGGLYMVSSSDLTIMDSAFSQNDAYGGCAVSSGSTVLFDKVQFSDHSIVGTSIVGNFLYGSNLTMNNVDMIRNSIVESLISQLEQSFVTMIAGAVRAYNVRISEVPASNKGQIWLGKMVEGNLVNLSLSNVANSDKAGLISFSFSKIKIESLIAERVTPLFSLYQTNLSLITISIQKLVPSSDSLYLFNTGGSNLTISKLDYTGGWDAGTYVSLFTGSSNRVIISKGRFLDAIDGSTNRIFDLRESSVFCISDSNFEYTNSTSQTLIFALESSETVVVEKCTFSQTGPLVQDENTKDSFYFTSNTIITDSNFQKISTTGNNKTHLLNNHFLIPMDKTEKPFPNSQIQILESSGLTKLKDNVFFSLYGSKGVVQIQCTKISYNLESIGNTFINSSGISGGAFHLDASVPLTSSPLPSVIINSSIFLLNTAYKKNSGSGNGGAIYQTTSTLVKQDTRISHSLFINNSAEMVGGAIFFDFMPPTVDRSSEFKSNSANFRPNHIGSYPIKLGYYEKEFEQRSPVLPWDTHSRFLSSSEPIRWENIPSGLNSNNSYIFALLDMFGQVFDSDNTSTLEVYPANLTQEERYTFSNKLSVVAVNGTYVYDSFKLIYKTYETINVIFKSTAIQQDRQSPLQSSLIPLDSLLVEIHFRGCGRGEYVLKEGNKVSCSECQPGFWQTSPVPDALSCQACDSDSTFCLGADNVGPLKGYWRLNETASIMHECPVSDSCLGSDPEKQDKDSRGTCAHGYTGNLCSNCIPGWAKIGNGACTNCSTEVWYYLRVVLVLLFQLALVVKAVYDTMTISKEFNQNQKLNLNNVILIRILTNYFQLISLVSGMPVTWPGAIKSILATFYQAASVTDNVFTLDCMFKSDHVYGVKVVFIKLLLTIIGPFALIALGILCTAIYFFIKKMPILGNRAFKDQIMSLTVIICFMMQPSAIQSAFSLFKCENLYREDSPAYFLTKDYDVQCWEGSHLYWAFGLGLPMLILWIIILPFLVFRALKQNKDRLDKPEIVQKYSFIYGGYTNDKYYWELVIMIRKFILICITIGASFHSLNLEVYVSVLLMLFYSLLQLFAHPYAEAKLNRLEQYALISAGVINFCGLYFRFISPTLWLNIVVIVCGLCGNLLFFVYFGLLYFALQIERIKQNKTVIKILAKVGEKCKCINPAKIVKTVTKASTMVDRLTTNKHNIDPKPNAVQPVKEIYSQEREDKMIAEVQSPFSVDRLLSENRLLSESFRDDNLRKVRNGEDIETHLKQIRFDSLNDNENQDIHEQKVREFLSQGGESESEDGSAEILTLEQLIARMTEG